MSNEEKYREELREWNRKLGQMLGALKFYLDSALSNGALGSDDPVTHTFKKRITAFETEAGRYRANNFEAPNDSELEPATASPFTYLLSLFQSMTGFGTNDAMLKSEIELRAQSFRRAQHVYTDMRRTTESIPRYSEISKAVPKDGKRLAFLDDGSTRTLLRRLDESHQKTIGIIEKDVVQPAWKALNKEVKFIVDMEMLSQDTQLRNTIESSSILARQFSIILNKYFDGGVDRGYAGFASDRFKALYSLVKNISVLLQALVKLAKPICDILNIVDLSPIPSTLQYTNPALYHQKSLERMDFLGELHRQRTLKSTCEKFELIKRLYREFVKRTENLMNAATFQPNSSEISFDDMSSHSRDDDSLSQLYRRIESLFEQDEDPAYIPISIPFSQGETTLVTDIIIDEVVSKLQELDLLKMTDVDYESVVHDEGSYGRVCRVPLQHSGSKYEGLFVSVKKFETKPDDNKTFKRFIREAVIMSDLNHKNVLRLFGYGNISTTNVTSTDISLVMAFYPDGNLQTYMSKRSVSELDRCKLLRDVASAIEYLHDPNKKGGTVIHGDLRAVNILVTPDKQALLCDFGLATRSNIDKKWQTKTNRTHAAWLAYEFFDIDLMGKTAKIPLTLKTDIYAYGCVFYEVLCGKEPYHDCEEHMISIYKYRKSPPNLDSLPKSYRLERGHRQLMVRCWHPEPSRRPSSSQLVQYLEEFISFLSPPRS